MTLEEILREAHRLGFSEGGSVDGFIRLAWDARGDAEYQRGYEAGQRDGEIKARVCGIVYDMIPERKVCVLDRDHGGACSRWPEE